MEIYYGAAFTEFTLEQLRLQDLFDRAVKKGLITSCGAEFLRNLK